MPEESEKMKYVAANEKEKRNEKKVYSLLRCHTAMQMRLRRTYLQSFGRA